MTTHSIYRLRIRGPGGSAGRSTRPGAADLSGVDDMECCSRLRADTTPIAEARPCSSTCRRVPNCTPDISAAAGNEEGKESKNYSACAISVARLAGRRAGLGPFVALTKEPVGSVSSIQARGVNCDTYRSALAH